MLISAPVLAMQAIESLVQNKDETNAFMKKIIAFIKKESVLSIAFVLAILSAFLVPIDKEYIGYMDFRVLVLLFALMTVMSGLQSLGIFEKLSFALLKCVKTTRGLALLLVSLCFFLSMFITNDVALITFVPFTLLIFDKIGNRKPLIMIVVLETIAANLGSMLTPIGNPQNLYLYGLSGFGIGQFLLHMAPLTILSYVLLAVCSLLLKKESISIADSKSNTGLQKPALTTYYFVLFVLCLLTVAYVIPYPVLLIVSIPILLIWDRTTLKKVDYCLLLTFISFFVFIGNLQRIPSVAGLISSLVEGRELIVAFLSSQLISNVPAAMLLSGFTDNYADLLLGVNIGGLGTLIASLASLISFKYFGNYAEKLPKEFNITKGKYLLQFTVMNVAFAVVLLGYVFIT